MTLDVLTLSRIQFALTIMFHYLFPPLTIGLGGLLVFMEGMYLKTRNLQYEVMTKFWTKVFAINFALGLPFVLAYTTVVYWVFRGKVQLGKFSY